MADTNALLGRILEVLESGKTVSNVLTVEGNFPREQKVVNHIAAPSKLEVARQWLKDHPEHKKKSTRWLEENITPMGVQISRTYWGKAKGKK